MFYHVKIVTVDSFSLKFLSKSPFIVWCHVLVAHLSQSLHFDNGQFIYFLSSTFESFLHDPVENLEHKGFPNVCPRSCHGTHKQPKKPFNEAKEVERCWSNLLLQIRFLLSPTDPSFEPWQHN